MNQRADIRLREAVLTDSHLLEQYQLQDSKYTTMPMKAATDSLRSLDIFPVLILAEDDLVGFFTLKTGVEVKTYTDEPNVLLLKSYSIDDRFQGKGFGKLSLQKVHGFVAEKFPGIKKVVLGVNKANIAAQLLYLKIGFLDTKRRIEGSLGVQFVLEMEIQEK